MKFIKLILLTISLAGCAVASGPAFKSLPEAVDGYSNIIVYRPFVEFKSRTRPTVYIDGKEIGPMATGGYLTTRIEPGPHTMTLSGSALSWDFGDLELNFRTAPSKNYYFELNVTQTLYYKMQAAIQEVTENHAKSRLQGLKHINHDAH